MTISPHDRKVLWARAHNACAICKRRLVHDAAPGDRESIVGDEAHIVARKPTGARARLRPDAELDTYDNLILLCKVDHQVVDDQPTAYPVERLQQIKADHERWADEQHGDLDPPPPVRLRPDPDSPQPTMMTMLLTGAQMWALLDGASSYVLESPSEKPASLEQCDLADQFLDTAKDWGEISENVTDRGLTAVREAQRALDKHLAELREHAMFVYGSRRRLVLTGGVFQSPTYWWEISLAVLTTNDPRLQDPQ